MKEYSQFIAEGDPDRAHLQRLGVQVHTDRDIHQVAQTWGPFQKQHMAKGPTGGSLYGGRDRDEHLEVHENGYWKYSGDGKRYAGKPVDTDDLKVSVKGDKLYASGLDSANLRYFLQHMRRKLS